MTRTYYMDSRKTVLTIIIAVMAVISAEAYDYSYSFKNIPVSEAIVKISKDHPEVNISFIYKELDNYKTSACIQTDDTYEALRQVVGINPISIIQKDRNFYVEALQHGRFCYTGRIIGNDNEPVAAATIMLLIPKDSTVITYGISDETGHFKIPCDRECVIAKLTCIGYQPTYTVFDTFAVGSIHMKELPVRLQAVNIEADNVSLLSDKSIYRPTQRQKNASQTATDLLARMGIPQLNTVLGSSNVTTASGQPVAMYINYMPATANDLKMMKMTDVLSVEYLEYPADPRFQGKRFVVNFIMTKYEYGGYVKALGTENFISNSGFLQANTRLVKKNMTYDIMGYGNYLSNNHFGTDNVETFRLPQDNGDVKSFKRESLTETSRFRKKNYETSFRALYSTDKVNANNQLAIGLDDIPHNDKTGLVKYTDNLLTESNYNSTEAYKAEYLKYNGFYYFSLPDNNALTTLVSYSYSHTDQSAQYAETSITPIYNGAKDNTHNGNIQFNYSQSFSNKHSLQVLALALYEQNHTDYSGSVDARDNSKTIFGQLGASYSFTYTKVSASLGAGWNWLLTRLNESKAVADYPYIDASLRFVPNLKNSFSTVFHYAVWPPSSNYKSVNIIQISPFLWHTGNPRLESDRSYDLGTSYTFRPHRKFNMTVFINSWFIGNRKAFVYEATPDGIIRTIQQPVGMSYHYNYGIRASVKQLDGKLHISGNLGQLIMHNGLPYKLTRSSISYYLQALYYLGNFNFAMSYQSGNASDNYDSMSGIWTKNKDVFVLQAGWSNENWNIRLTAQNLQRWNWRASYSTMNSDSYSINKWASNATAHAFIQLSATYTFGFGKKVRHDNEPVVSGSASSGILK